MEKWHDLRKNLSDLPNDERHVWTNVGAGYHDDYGWWDDFGRLYDVIAWCEPKFEDVPREESITELKEQNRKLLESCEGATMMHKDLCRAKEVLEGLMRFCRCFAQHHTEDIRYKEAEKFLEEL